jgi:hypothetical protein
MYNQQLHQIRIPVCSSAGSSPPMFVDIYIYIYIYTLYIYTHTLCLYGCTCVTACVHVLRHLLFVDIHVYAYVRNRMCICYQCMYVYLCMHALMCVCTHIHTCRHTHTHIRTHAHISTTKKNPQTAITSIRTRILTPHPMPCT